MRQLSAETKATMAAGGMLALLGAILLVWVVEPAWLLFELDRGWQPIMGRARLERVLKRDPLNLRAQGHLMRHLIDDGDMVRAESILFNLKTKDPEGYFTYMGTCKFALVRGMGDNPSCQKALDRSPRSVDDLNNTASMYLRTKSRINYSVELLNEALAQDPRNVKVLNNLGLAHLMLKNYDLAFESLNQALALDPRLITARKNLARVYYASSDNCSDEKIERCRLSLLELEKILMDYPDDDDALISMAIIYAMHLHDIALGEKYAIRAYRTGKNQERAKLVLQDIATLKAGDTPAPGEQITP